MTHFQYIHMWCDILLYVLSVEINATHNFRIISLKRKIIKKHLVFSPSWFRCSQYPDPCPWPKYQQLFSLSTQNSTLNSLDACFLLLLETTNLYSSCLIYWVLWEFILIGLNYIQQHSVWQSCILFAQLIQLAEDGIRGTHRSIDSVNCHAN